MLELGILKTFDSENHKAGVQLAGSLTTYLDDISVSVSIPSSAMVVGNYVLVAIPGGNPRDACVVASWPQGSSGGGGAKIQDADGDTYLWVEKTTDEDKIHGVVKGVEAFLLDDVGILSLVKQSAAKAHMSANQGIPVSQAMTQCHLNVEDYDVQGEFNTSTYRFTTSKAGRYLAVGIVCYYYGSTLAGHHHEGVIRKNNVNTIMGASDSSVNYQSQFIHMIGIVDLAVNDYLTLHTKHNYSSTRYIEKNQTTLMVMKVS